MYGTIARFHIRPGMKDEFVKTMDSFGDAVIAGWVADYYFQMENDFLQQSRVHNEQSPLASSRYTHHTG